MNNKTTTTLFVIVFMLLLAFLYFLDWSGLGNMEFTFERR